MIVYLALGIAAAGFLLSLWLALIEWRRYHLPLQVRLDWLTVTRLADNDFVIQIRSCFVNPASRGKTVYQVLLGMPNNVTCSEIRPRYDEDQHYLIYEFPIGDKSLRRLVESAIIQSFDVAPNQSLCKWSIYRVVVPPQYNIQNLSLDLVCLDVFDKPFARYKARADLKTSQVFPRN